MTDLTVHPKEKDQVYRREAAAVDEDATRVVGTTQLYREDGRIRLIPMPTPDPRDPLNLPVWRKRFAVSVLCFCESDLRLSIHMSNPPRPNQQALGEKTVGALALSAEVVIGGLIPIFILEYAGVDPRSIRAAALSPSLGSHLAARAVQGLGAGAVEALIPLVLQDMFFLHERNTWMSTIVSSQGVIIIALGIASPYIAANHSWRWIYRVTTGFGAVAWALLLLFLPEARWARSKEELNRFFVRLEPSASDLWLGHNVYDIAPDEDRPQLDTARFRARSAWDDVGVFNCGFDWREAGVSMLDTLRTTFLPGWRFELTGLGVLPFVAAALFVYVFAGPVADRVSMSVTRRRSRGGKVDGDANNSNSNSNKNNNAMAREAEDNLPNFILPFALGIAGAFLFGAAAQQRMHWAVLLLASFLVIFAYLTVLTLGNVLVVESYPVWAGPVLVNVGSMRITVAFFLASRAVEWVQAAGPLATFAMYGEALLVIALGIPALFFCGKRLRAWTAGRVGVVGAAGGGRSGDGEAGVV
ncbi:hypothetical protein RB601_007875 [Gaeumannomyces tritici]